MKKSIISVFISICLLLNIVPVFAEYTLQSNTEYGIINTDELTDDNIIYKELQNNNGAALLNDTDNQITTDFDIVFAPDMSADMYQYDINGEMLWLDEFEALQEQVPKGTRFTILPQEESAFTDTLDINTLREYGYSITSDIISTLDSCINTFDDDTSSRNKVVIATASKVTDTQALANKMDELRNYGVIPFVFVLNSEPDGLPDNIENVYQCANDLELRLAISDLYLAFAEFHSASMYTSKTALISNMFYKSDFKDKHLIKENSSSSGKSIVSILNMYGCVPLYASLSEKKNYNITEHSNNDILSFVNSDNSSLSDSAANDISFLWDDIYNGLDERTVITFNTSDNLNAVENTKELLKKNLKRRFPVIVEQDSKFKIITGYDPQTSEVTMKFYSQSVPVAETKDIACLGDNYKIFDTYQYLTQTASTVQSVNDKTTFSGLTIKLYSVYPTDYQTTDNVTVIQLHDENGNINGTMDYSIDGNSVTVNMLMSDVADNNWVVTAAKTTFVNGIANIYNQNRIYNLRAYNDVKTNNWYNDFLFKATNLGIINGDENGRFNAKNKVKRCEFVKMALETAKISTSSAQEGEHWAKGYMDRAAELGILFWPEDADYDEEICRYEAAYILKTLLMDKIDDTVIPTLLYTYDENVQSIQKTNWNKVESEFKNDIALEVSAQTKAKSAFYQMYMNSVFVGNESGKINPYDKLTRAEATKIVIKPLFELDENLPQILVNFDENENKEIITPITFDGYETTIDNIIFDGRGNRVFEFTINSDDDCRYIIETIGDIVEDSVISLDIKAKGSGQLGQYGDAGKYYVYGADTYTITVRKTGIANVGLHICAINAPQNIVFNQNTINADGTKNYYIFDDHPEFVRRCDILNDDTYTPASLIKAENLEPGTYTVFAYHHVANKNVGSKYTTGAAFENDAIVYFDSAFYNMIPHEGKTGRVTITKLGIEHLTAQDGWSKLLNVWTDFQGSMSATVFDSDQVGGVKTLSQIQEEFYNINVDNNYGFVWLMMEFKVEDCTISYADIAYQEKPEQSLESTRNDAINKIDSSVCSYETLETVKGIGNASQTIDAVPMEYIIDDSVDDEMLSVIIENQLNGISKQKFFTTNISPFTTNNRYTTPKSSEISIELPYTGITRKMDGTIENTVSPNNDKGVWIFDTEHSKQTKPVLLPEEFKVGSYSEKTELNPNEEFDKNWMKSIVNINNSAFEAFQGRDLEIDKSA